MIKLTSPIAVIVLAALMASGQLANVMYLPAFPAMAEYFGVGAERIQLTLSTYMVGLALAQLLYGPLADRFGRKPILLIGLSLFTAGSVACTLADTIGGLLVYRFLQAFGAAAGTVLPQAMVRDSFEPPQAARTLAYIASTMAVAPAIAPVFGGLLLVQFGWSSIFLTLTLIGGLLLTVMAVSVPETLVPGRRQALHPAIILGNYGRVVRSRVFLGHALALSCMFSAHYAFMSGASFVLIELFGVAESRFGWYFMAVVLAFITGNLTGARLSRYIDRHPLVLLGGVCLSCGGALMALLTLLGVASPTAIIGPQLLSGLGAGILLPQLISGALAPFPQMAGTAAALLGFFQMSAAAFTSWLVGYLYDGTARPMAFTIAAAGAGALLIYLLLARGNAMAKPVE